MYAAITGVGGYVPDYVLTNDELSRMVDTNDEWIMSHVGIKERRILKGEGMGSSEMGALAVKQLLEKTGVGADEIELVICATTTPDHVFPNCGSMICDKVGIKNAFAFDLSIACCGFLTAMETASSFIRSGRYKKVIVVCAEKMSSITDYTDRSTCPLFGDGSAAVLLEPNNEYGWMDAEIHTDGSGGQFLKLPAGGSAYPATEETVRDHKHYLWQKGPTVYKFAVTHMADVSASIMERNHLRSEDVNWFIPHQANLRIIDAAVNRINVPYDKVLINIQRYGNTSGATIALCLWDFEKRLKKGDNIVMAAFGAGFSWAGAYMKWAYDPR
ncbi:MAG: ketoacyl-ACP synthase III [Paludibacteraceae bacterium]|nr:ketoacyl-ACP synthase III [Paludibacteraceae bacterium]